MIGTIGTTGTIGTIETTGALRMRVSHMALIPTLGAAILPRICCPACWPAWAGLLAAVHVLPSTPSTPSSLLRPTLLLPVTASLLLVALAPLAYRALRHRGYFPCLLGLAGASAILAGKFFVISTPLTYAGTLLLVTASLWHGWPRRRAACSCTPAAAPGGSPLP